MRLFKGGFGQFGPAWAFEEHSRRYGWKIHIPKFAYTTDNAAMVAITGYYKYLDGEFCSKEVAPYARVSI